MGNTLYMCKRTSDSVPGHDPEASGHSDSDSDDDEEGEGILYDRDAVKEASNLPVTETQPEEVTVTSENPQGQGFENPFLGVHMRSIDSDSDQLSSIPEEDSNMAFDSDTDKLGLPPDPEEEEVEIGTYEQRLQTHITGASRTETVSSWWQEGKNVEQRTRDGN